MSKRIERVNQLIKRELSQIILREIDLSEKTLVTVTRVESALNLNQVKVYISVMQPSSQVAESKSAGSENKVKSILETLNRQIYFIQQKLNKRLKMRPIPKIRFIEEKKAEEAGKIDELLEEIRKQQHEI